MKQCPRCQGLELYDDAETTCPHCDATLIPYVRSRRNQNNSYEDTEPVKSGKTASRQARADDPVFERRMGNHYQFRGVVVSISPTSRFMANSVKIFNSLFRGQPYQVGNPVHETILRIEEISHSRIPDQMRSLVYYGELGELDVGDDVTIRALGRNGRLIVKELIINDIETSVRPHGTLSAAAVRVLSLLAIGLIVLLLAMIVSFFTSGGIWRLLSTLVGGAMSLASKLIVTLAPILILLFIYWLFFHRHK